tara:strand:- start:13 stop:732 length:720 start_codon:yes stop_codon:yes gene_type:complete
MDEVSLILDLINSGWSSSATTLDQANTISTATAKPNLIDVRTLEKGQGSRYDLSSKDVIIVFEDSNTIEYPTVLYDVRNEIYSFTLHLRCIHDERAVGTSLTGSGGAYTTGSTNMTLTSTTGIAVGMEVTGTGIPDGTTVSGITNSTTIVLSATPTKARNGQSITFNSRDSNYGRDRLRSLYLILRHVLESKRRGYTASDGSHFSLLEVGSRSEANDRKKRLFGYKVTLTAKRYAQTIP